MPRAPRSAAAEQTRQRTLAAAGRLLAEGGRDAVTNRAVAAAAGVQAPAIYRLFGDQRGLLDEVALRGFEAHLIDKSVLETTGDPVADLRAGWDQHIRFGLTNPDLYVLVYGDPRPGPLAPAAAAATDLLAKFVHRVAEAGRLRVSEDAATQLIQIAGRGTTLTFLATPPEQRDMSLSDLAREAVMSAITTDTPATGDPSVPATAIAMRAALRNTNALSEAEGALMDEWLARIAEPAKSRE